MRAGKAVKTPAAPDHSDTPARAYRRVVGRIGGTGPAIPRTVVGSTIDTTRGLLAFLGTFRSVPVILRAIVPARVLVSLLTSDKRAPGYQHERYHLRLFHVCYLGYPFSPKCIGNKKRKKSKRMGGLGKRPFITRVLPHTGRACWDILLKSDPRLHRWSAG